MDAMDATAAYGPFLNFQILSQIDQFKDGAANILPKPAPLGAATNLAKAGLPAVAVIHLQMTLRNESTKNPTKDLAK